MSNPLKNLCPETQPQKFKNFRPAEEPMKGFRSATALCCTKIQVRKTPLHIMTFRTVQVRFTSSSLAMPSWPRLAKRPAIQAQMKKLQVQTHPGGSAEPSTLSPLNTASVWKDEYICHCFKCSCEACMGMAKKGHKAPCSLAAGSFLVRKAYPKFWPEYFKMVAHGISLEDARREIKKLYEFDTFQKKERAKFKRQRQQEEEAKKNAKNMADILHLKKQSAAELQEEQHGIRKKSRKKSLCCTLNCSLMGNHPTKKN